jgi:hypothetical protein
VACRVGFCVLGNRIILRILQGDIISGSTATRTWMSFWAAKLGGRGVGCLKPDENKEGKF